MTSPLKTACLAIGFFSLTLFSCRNTGAGFDPDTGLAYCHRQVLKTISAIGDTDLIPVNIPSDDTRWILNGPGAWTSGFWPGILWYDYENSGDEEVLEKAIHFTGVLEPVTWSPASDHDLGFRIFCSYGNGYRLTGRDEYRRAILRTADALATLYRPVPGTILSWPHMRQRMDWPHNTIVDNMMNLEMLLWASKNGGGKELYDIAVSHADRTMEHQFRPDGSNYHVAVYDTISGKFLRGVTHQGYADNSMWARGQAWAIYGFTVMFRETGDPRYLRFARKLADVYLLRLPADRVPYWDFDALNIPDAPRDASAAAITASALIELSALEDSDRNAKRYLREAVRMLEALSSPDYQSRYLKPSFLLHSTGHMPGGSEVDASIIYADYYYIEALTRLKKLKTNKTNGK